MVSLDEILGKLHAVIEASDADLLSDELVAMGDAALCELAKFIITTDDATPAPERQRASVDIISYMSTRASLFEFELKKPTTAALVDLLAPGSGLMAWNDGLLPAESLFYIFDVIEWVIRDESGALLFTPDQLFAPDGFKFAKGHIDWKEAAKFLSGSHESSLEAAFAETVKRLLDGASDDQKMHAAEAGVYEELKQIRGGTTSFTPQLF